MDDDGEREEEMSGARDGRGQGERGEDGGAIEARIQEMDDEAEEEGGGERRWTMEETRAGEREQGREREAARAAASLTPLPDSEEGELDSEGVCEAAPMDIG